IKSADVAAALRTALNDSSYSTEANALTSLSKIDSTNAVPFIKARYDVWSYSNQVANAALNGIARVDTVEAVNVAMKKVQYGAEVLGRNTAMSVMKKYGKTRNDVKSLCASLLNDKSYSVKYNAADFLGDNGNESHLAALQVLADKKNDGASGAAKKAIEKIKERTKK
ncbi:MAG: HEAT repeat domain-containing protein, partial [Bacteroidota bacterium]